MDDGNHPRSGKNVTCMARTYADHSNAIKAIEKTEKYALEGKKKKMQRGQLILEIMPHSSYF